MQNAALGLLKGKNKVRNAAGRSPEMPGNPVVKKAEGISRGFRISQDALGEEDGEGGSATGGDDAGAIGREAVNLVEAVPWGAGELREALGFCLAVLLPSLSFPNCPRVPLTPLLDDLGDVLSGDRGRGRENGCAGMWDRGILPY